MRRLPLVPLLAFTAALAIPLGVAAVVAAGRGETLWVALHACARAGAAAVSLLGLLALALAASAVGAALLELAHQARAGRRALRSARAGALMPAPELVAFARDLGLSRLVVVESKERIAFCAGLLRPCVAISTAVCDALEPSALRALLAHEAAHARRRDPLRQVLGAAATRALWLVPPRAPSPPTGGSATSSPPTARPLAEPVEGPWRRRCWSCTSPGRPHHPLRSRAARAASRPAWTPSSAPRSRDFGSPQPF